MTETTGFKKISEHPKKKEIIEKLIAGNSVRKIESWLKQEFPNNKKSQISHITLQKFRKSHLLLASKKKTCCCGKTDCPCMKAGTPCSATCKCMSKAKKDKKSQVTLNMVKARSSIQDLLKKIAAQSCPECGDQSEENWMGLNLFHCSNATCRLFDSKLGEDEDTARNKFVEKIYEILGRDREEFTGGSPNQFVQWSELIYNGEWPEELVKLTQVADEKWGEDYVGEVISDYLDAHSPLIARVSNFLVKISKKKEKKLHLLQLIRKQKK